MDQDMTSRESATDVDPVTFSILSSAFVNLVDEMVSALCLRGYDNLCRNGGLLGRDVDGVCAEYVAVPEDQLHEVPTAVSADAAPLLQVLGTVVHAQRSVEPDATECAVVIGLGISGLLHLQMLLHRGF